MTSEGARLEAVGVSGAPAPGRLTTTFRLDGLLLDTGAAVHGLPIEEQKQISDVLLSHAHFDHTLGLPFLLGRCQNPRIWGLPHTLETVRAGTLNGQIWPDLASRADWIEVEAGVPFDVAGWNVESAPSSHTIPCLSYVFRKGDARVAVVGDTRYDEDHARWIGERSPSHCVVECSYPDAKAEIARDYGHQTPADLPGWRNALGTDVWILVTHLKPETETQVRAEIAALEDPKIRVLGDGDVFSV